MRGFHSWWISSIHLLGCATREMAYNNGLQQLLGIVLESSPVSWVVRVLCLQASTGRGYHSAGFFTYGLHRTLAGVCWKQDTRGCINTSMECTLPIKGDGNGAGTSPCLFSESCNAEGLSGESFHLFFSFACGLSSSIISLFLPSSCFTSV